MLFILWKSKIPRNLAMCFILIFVVSAFSRICAGEDFQKHKDLTKADHYSRLSQQFLGPILLDD